MSRFAPLLGERMRRDGVQVLLWAAGTGLLAVLTHVGVVQSYGTTEDRASILAAALATPVILLLRGLPSGAEQGAFTEFLIFPWLALLAALMSTFLAVRHTRGDEEVGRTELVAATPAGRVLPVAATVVHGILANALLGALVTIAFLGVGLPVPGAVLAGAATGAVGVVFLAVGLTAAQLVRTSRAANAVSVWVTICALLIAGIGNAIGTPSADLTSLQSSWLAWLSPFGWGENTRAFGGDLWWPLLVCGAVALALIGLALVLTAVREVGESFMPERRGRGAATALLSSPTGLVWRLTRGAIAGWAAGGLLTGILSTSLAGVVGRAGAADPAVAQVLAEIARGGDVREATVTVFFTMLGVLAACAAVQVVCRTRQEEARGTAEPVLATPVGRVRWLADHLVIGFAAIVLVVLAAVAGAALGIAGQPGDGDLVRDVLVTGGGQVAAASVFLVVTAVVFALAPRATIPLGWTLVLVGTVLGLFGPLFGFPAWVTNLSPVAVAPRVAGADVDLGGLWWLVVATGAGAALALGLMRRREPAG